MKCVNRMINLQLLLCGDEAAERLAYEVACELGYATPDGLQVQVSILNSHASHFKVNIKLNIKLNIYLLHVYDVCLISIFPNL